MTARSWHVAALLSCAQLAACSSPPPARPPAPAPPAPAPVEAPPAPRPKPYGMWLPSQLPEQADILKRLGLELPADTLSDPARPPLSAVVSLGGCSASFISPDGLLLTNHHCVSTALSVNSSEEHNYVEDGFHAHGHADEVPAGATARVYITQSLKNITAAMTSGLDELDDRARFQAIEDRTKEQIKQCEAQTSSSRCDVAGIFGGGQFLLVHKVELKDVRLVYAPPRALGQFGGDEDNWQWPRQGADFSLLRAYVAPDGAPAPYAKDNVPYKPSHYLPLAKEGLAPDDFVFVAGYPGRTSRLRTAWELREILEWRYPRGIERAEQYVARIEQLAKTSHSVGIKATQMLDGWNNGLKYMKGALEGLSRTGAIPAKEDLERQIVLWVEKDPERLEKYGTVFTELDRVFATHEETRDADDALTELTHASRLLGAAITIVRMAEQREKPDEQREPAYQQRNLLQLEQSMQILEQLYSNTLDKGLLTLALERASALPVTDRPQALAVFLPSTFGKQAVPKATIQAAVGKLFRYTRMARERFRLDLLRTATKASIAKSRDPMIILARKLLPLIQAAEERQKVYQGALYRLRPAYVRMLREYSPGPLAPDANGTLRITYGKVIGFRPTRRAPVYFPFSTVTEQVAKHTGKEPFNLPEPYLELAKAAKQSRFAPKFLGDVPVDFLADLDITGGNSGSPTINARGELVGVAFDGNYESISSDFWFDPDVTRSIHVDIRYILWLLQEYAHATELLQEVGIAPGAPSLEQPSNPPARPTPSAAPPPTPKP